MPPKLSIEAQKLIDAEACNQERHCQACGVKSGQQKTAFPSAAGRRQPDDASKNRPDARRPARSECNAERQRSQHAVRFCARELARVFVEILNFQQSDEM